MLAIISMIPGMIQGENTEEQRLELLINQKNTKDKCKKRKKEKKQDRGEGKNLLVRRNSGVSIFKNCEGFRLTRRRNYFLLGLPLWLSW